MKKYLIEIELTNHCSLKCKVCISKDLNEKGFIDEETYDLVLNYILKNYKNIECVVIGGLGDNFLHPKIISFLDKLKVLKDTGILIFIPTKGLSINEEIVKKLKELKDNGMHIDVQIGLFSLNKDVINFLFGVNKKFDYLAKLSETIKLFKSNGINFSFELLLTKLSENEINVFHKFCKDLKVNGEAHRLHNFGGKLVNYNSLKSSEEFYSSHKSKEACIERENCHSNKCGFYPYINFRGDIYPGTFCCHYEPINIRDFKNKNYNFVINRFIDIIDIENPFCKKCTYNNTKTYENIY